MGKRKGKKNKYNFQMKKNVPDRSSTPVEIIQSPDVQNSSSSNLNIVNEPVEQSQAVFESRQSGLFWFKPVSLDREWCTTTVRNLNSAYGCNLIQVPNSIEGYFQGVGNLYRECTAQPVSINKGGNGNCLFHSISFLLTGSPHYHKALRKATHDLHNHLEVSELLEPRYNEHYRRLHNVLVPIDQSQRARHHLDNEFAGNFSLFLLASLLHIEIVIVQINEVNGNLTHESFPPIFLESLETESNEQKMFIKFFLHAKHYEPIAHFKHPIPNPQEMLNVRSVTIMEQHSIDKILEQSPADIVITGFKTDFHPELDTVPNLTYFIDSSKCFVYYCVNGSYNRRVRLDELIAKETFPVEGHSPSPECNAPIVNSPKPKSVDRARIMTLMEDTLNDIRITGFQTDHPTPQRLPDFAPYINSRRCFVFYTLNGSGEKKITLNNLLQQGFPKEVRTGFQYYSCHRLVRFDKEYTSLLTEAAFLEMLGKIDDYYKRHHEARDREQLEPFKGPQNFGDRLRPDKLYYYGRGNFPYYRLRTLHKLIEEKFSAITLAEFKANPLTPSISDEDFEGLLYDVNRYLTQMRNHDTNKFFMTPFAGPQCCAERNDLDKLHYDVAFVNRQNEPRSDPQPEIVQDVSCTPEESQEPDLTDGFIRRCATCDKYRVLDKRAARKYALGYYHYENGEKTVINFTCELLVDINCETPSDLKLLSGENIELPHYFLVLLSQKESSQAVGVFVQNESDEKSDINGVFKVKVVKSIGKTLEKFEQAFTHNEITAISISKDNVQVGFFPTKRFRPFGKKAPLVCFEFVNVVPREARCCTPWHDDPNVDPEDPTVELSMKFMTAVRNMHCISNNLKRLRCCKCNCESVELENYDDILLSGGGDRINVKDKKMLDVLKTSEVRQQSVQLHPKFCGTDVYKSSDTYVESICTECAPFYKIQDGHVSPVYDRDNPDFNSEAYINPYGIENLVSLNTFNDLEFRTHTNSLSRAEQMVCARVHLCVTILRDRVNKIPWSIGGSIVFGRRGGAVIADFLPWTNFHEMPLIVIKHKKSDRNIVEATISMEKLRKQRYFMEKICLDPVTGEERPQYRYCSEAFSPFSNDKMAYMKNVQLEGQDSGVPKDLRVINVNQLKDRERRPLEFEEFRNWILSGFEFGTSLRDSFKQSLLNSNELSVDNFETKLWNSIVSFAKSAEADDSEAVDIFIKTIVEYGIAKKYFDPQTDAHNLNPCGSEQAPFDFHYVISEELSVLSAESSNDAGDMCGVVEDLQPTDLDPRTIMSNALRNTALRRITLPPYDRSNPIPETMIGYLPMALPQLFLSGDGCLNQTRPRRINRSFNDKEKYFKWFARQPETSLIPEAVFLNSNTNKRNQAQKSGMLGIGQFQRHSDLPTVGELRNDEGRATHVAGELLQFKSSITNSPAFWRREGHVVTGNERYLEDPTPWKEREFPIYPKDFQTRATPHYHGRGIHRLMPDFNSSDPAEVQLKTRMKNVLKYPQIVAGWSAKYAELSAKYFTPLRFDADLYVTRAEWGPKSGNPHFHQLTFSEGFSKMIFEGILEIHAYFAELCNEASSSGHALTDPDTQTVITAHIMEEWEALRAFYGEKMATYSSQWNPGLTRDGKRRTYEIDCTRLNIAQIDMAETTHLALKSGNFKAVDEIYTSVVNQTCRHTMHTGKGGKPSKTDYCCTIVKKIDKTAMENVQLESGKKPPKMHKVELKCKRRFPRRLRDNIEIYKDPYNPKLTQLGLPSNDKWMNGGDPFSALVWLHNIDDKAVIPPQLVKCPIIDWNPCRDDPDAIPLLEFYPGTNDLAADYIVKYQFKPPVPTRLPAEMLLAACESMDPSDQINVGTLQKTQNAMSLQSHTCIFEAIHVNLHYPLVMTNMESKPVNTAGLHLLRNDYQESDGDNYVTGIFQKFDKRMQDAALLTLNGVAAEEFQREMSVQEFFDTYDVTESRPRDNDPERRLTISKKSLVKAGKWQFVRMTPHVTRSRANPKSKEYWKFCRWMVLYRKPLLYTSDVCGHPDANTESYWINEFYTSFPKGRGLPEYARRWYRDFHPDEFIAFPSDSSDASTDNESDIENEGGNPSNGEKDLNAETDDHRGIPLAKNVNEQFVQDEVDKMRNLDQSQVDANDVQQPLVDLHAMANPSNINVHSWLRGNNVPTQGRIYKGLDELKKIKKSTGAFEGSALNGKQQLVRDLIVNFVEDELKFGNGELLEAPDPLRLVVMGKPGAGKSFAVKQALSDLQRLFPGENDWERHVKTCAPSGAAAFQLGFGATTCHSKFKIKVGRINAPLSDKELADFIEELGPDVKLIIFDEFSMLSRELFNACMNRLKEAGHHLDHTGLLSRVGFVFVGDPAQILPVGGIFLWSPSLKSERGTSSNPAAEISEFRTQMRLNPLSKLPHYNQWIDLDSSTTTVKDDNLLQKQSNFRFLSCYGNYKAVYLDEVRRTINNDDPLQIEWLKIMESLRYGHVTPDQIKFMHDNFATEDDMKKDDEWKSKFILMGYHYYSEDHPNRVNAQSENATAVANLAREYNIPILEFTAYHDPPDKRLEKVSDKEYRNLQSTLWLFESLKVMLLSNICPPLKLFNGSLHKYIGPLYLNKVYELKVRSSDIQKCVSDGIFVTPFPVRGTSFHQIPVGSTVLSIDGKRPPVFPSRNREIVIRVEFPGKPPSLPDYQVIEVEGYEASGGPNILGLDFTQNMVPIKLVCYDRNKKGRKKTSRIQSPLECGCSFTSFKVQGATIPRAKIRLQGFHGKPGNLLASVTRTKSYKHNHIPEDEFPTAHEVRMQRLNPQVQTAECCEKMVRVIASKTLRDFSTAEGPYGECWSQSDKSIADRIHKSWVSRLSNSQQTSADETIRNVALELNAAPNDVARVYDRMLNTDESFLIQPPPTITSSEIEELLAFKSNRAPAAAQAQSDPPADRTRKRNRLSAGNKDRPKKRPTRQSTRSKNRK